MIIPVSVLIIHAFIIHHENARSVERGKKMRDEEEEDGAEDWMEDASFGICVIRLHVIFSIFHGLERHAIFNQTRDWIGLRTFRVKPKL